MRRTKVVFRDCSLHGRNTENATSEDYTNLRAQVWFACRDWLRDGGQIPDDEKLIGELVAPKYLFDARGRMAVTAKKDIKKIIKRSPDRADALCLAVFKADKMKRGFSASSFLGTGGLGYNT